MQTQWECEEWRPVVGYEGIYIVSDQARIMRVKPADNTKPGRIIRDVKARGGYRKTTLCKDNVRRTHNVHRIVVAAFWEQPEGYNQVNHKNGIRTDNRADNLEWCTPKLNRIHACRVLGSGCGERNGNAVLSADDVREVRRLLGAGMTRADVARFFGVNWNTISDIFTGFRWGRVA